MDLIQENYKEEFVNDISDSEKCTAENSEENSSPDDHLKTNGIDGEPSISPRIGDQYQAEIPPLLSEKERVHMSNLSTENNDLYSGKELLIPIIWSPKDKSCSNTGVKNSLDSNCMQTEHSASNCVEYVKRDDCIPLPDSPTSPWSDSESLNFVLGLYVYGKNLSKVQKFIETKTMGDILRFYYGKFYSSEPQRKWVEWRKDKRRRRIIGYRIFTGVRQQEFLARLLPVSTEYIQDRLNELLKAFNEGIISLEVLLLTLKDIIGIPAMVEAVGIGKGKQDLTRVLQEAGRSNQNVRARAEVPAGKSWSSLTSDEIVNYLTGDYRLSKAKSNDLFWEAVWPRLLARGWHSEQPSDITSLTAKNPLVFLFPGVKKFSRKKLLKGNHYFDSVSDVLSKVASDPKLIDLDSLDAENEPEALQNDESNFKKPSYLQPRVHDNTSDLMKFTIVDTSLVLNGKSLKMRELRSIPANASNKHKQSFNHRYEISSNDSSSDQSHSYDPSLKSQNGQNSVVMGEKDPLKIEVNRKLKSKQLGSAVPKRQRLTSCSSSVSLSRQNVEPETNNAVAVEAVTIAQPPPPSPAAAETAAPRTFIDLNLHPQEFEIEEPKQMDIEVPMKETVESNAIANNETNTSGRRHGTRNRPPTTKALEALESGFFTEQKEKSLKNSRPRSMSSRTARRARKNTDSSVSVASAGVGEYSGGSTSHVASSNWFDGSRVQSERNEAHELIGMSNF